MKKVFLSDSGPVTSDSIYSFWRWNESKDLTVENIEDITNYCLDLGINSFDLSNSYGLGQTEELFGKVLENKSIKREDIVLFSKCGYKSNEVGTGKVIYNQLTEKYINKSVDESLKKLKTDYIDVFLLNEFDPLMKSEEVVSALTTLVYKGKVKHIGLSGFNVFQHRLVSNLSLDIVTNHFELNLFNTSAIHDGRLDFIKEQYAKPMAWAPLAGGRILNGTDAEALAIRSVLDDLAVKYNSNVEQLAVAWINKLGALPIIGSLNKERIKNAATASDINLSHEDWHRIYNVTKKIMGNKLANIENLKLVEVLQQISDEFGERAAFSTSLSWEDQVITHHIFENDLPIRVFTLDTGRLFPETYGVFNRTIDRYKKNIEVFFPKHEGVEKMVTEKGPLSFYASLENRKECCFIRKVEPLNRALENVDCWITGLRSEHSENRKEMSMTEKDEQRNLVKVHPILHWTFEAVKEEIKKNHIPYNSLHDKGFVSIGCQPCTRAVQEGEDFRAGRWWWENNDKKECGLHA